MDSPETTPGTAQQPAASGPSPHAEVERRLRERVKELDCLYAVSRLAQRNELSLGEFAAAVAGLLPASWQHPELACARVRIDGSDYATPDFRRTRLRQSSPVRAHGARIGSVEVCYRVPRGRAGEIAFLDEERALLDAVAESLGRAVEAKRAEEHLRELSGELLRAQEAERQRIARELHDEVAQDLGMLKLGLETLPGVLPGIPAARDEIPRRRIAELSALAARTIAAVRDLSYGLMPPALAQVGLAGTLRRLCEEFSARSGIEVDFRAHGMDTVHPGFEFSINLYRIVQEALVNARRHAGAGNVVVRLVASHPLVILRVEDDGRGFDIEKRSRESLHEKRMGLWSMRERARLLGGVLRLRSAPGKGTRIVVELPLEAGHG